MNLGTKVGLFSKNKTSCRISRLRFLILHPEFPYKMRTIITVVTGLTFSNLFMTFAWYGHLKNMKSYHWIIAALLSWGIALFEYMIQVPTNRIGSNQLSVGQLKIMQEVITLSVFVPFSILYLKEPFKTNYLWAGLCMVGAVYFMFKQ